MLKKAVSVLFILTLILILSSCSKSETLEGLLHSSGKTEVQTAGIAELSDVETADKHPFEEGCFVGKEYVLETVFTGRDAENTYNTMLFRKDTGACVFTGIAFDVEPDATGMSVLSDTDEKFLLHAEKDHGSREIMTVRLSYGGEAIDCMCGTYGYAGGEWTPDCDLMSAYLTPGRYFSANGVFRMSITEDEGVMTFDITDAFRNRQVFFGRIRSAGDGITRAVLLNEAENYVSPEEKQGDTSGETRVEFEKCASGGSRYVEVTCRSAEGTAEYSGRYKDEGRETLGAGLYTCGDRTLRITRSNVKGSANPSGNYKHSEVFTLTDGDDKVLFRGTKEYEEGARVDTVSFEENGKRLTFYKGVFDGAEYAEILNRGYLDGLGVCERYELSEDNSR